MLYGTVPQNKFEWYSMAREFLMRIEWYQAMGKQYNTLVEFMTHLKDYSDDERRNKFRRLHDRLNKHIKKL